MTVVIDASVALKWVLDEPGTKVADALLDEDLIAPAVWLIEAANALWRRARSGQITAEESAERLAELLNAPVAATPIEDDLIAAATLSSRLGHPVYDCLYLALALRHDTHVITADRRFHAAVAAVPDLAEAVRMLGA